MHVCVSMRRWPPVRVMEISLYIYIYVHVQLCQLKGQDMARFNPLLFLGPGGGIGCTACTCAGGCTTTGALAAPALGAAPALEAAPALGAAPVDRSLPQGAWLP